MSADDDQAPPRFVTEFEPQHGVAVPVAELQGRIAAVMLVPYPPGIPLIMPGERFTPATRSIIDYLEFARTFDRSFPGFDSDVHGLQHQDSPDGRCYTVDCIKE